MSKVYSYLVYRKWWHRVTRHKTVAHFVEDENITWYFDTRKKEWYV